MVTTRIIDDLLELLDSLPMTEQRMFVGLDGYVDRIQKVVQSQGVSENQYFDTMPELAQRIGQAAGKSAQLELVNQTVKAGGNAPIMSHALGRLGVANVCLGSFGEKNIHPVFQTMSNNCELLSLGKPAETNALEFDDGKLILSEVSAFSRLDWNFVQQQYPVEQLTQILNPCQMVALVDWCNLPLATDVWQGLLKDVIPQLGDDIQRQYFFDLADPGKKSVAEIRKVTGVISRYEAYGAVTLGLNENEAYRLYHTLIGKTEGQRVNLEAICQRLFDYLNISCLLVHPLDRTIVANREGVQTLAGHLVKKPVISTGGGDNLNAGFCFARLAGCTDSLAAVLGMATSGAYVQNGHSPNLTELQEYLRQWRDS